MPISLPPISRRRFLRRSLAVGAGLAVSPNLFAAGKRTGRKLLALLAISILRPTLPSLAGHQHVRSFTTVSRELIARRNVQRAFLSAAISPSRAVKAKSPLR